MAASLIIVLSICLLLCVAADPPITAHPGDDVTLLCQASNNVGIAAVEWTRPDLEKHLYLKSDGRVNTADQDPSYVNRVQLKDDEMKNGDLSLVLKNVNTNDGGRYQCRYVEERGGRRKRSDPIKHISIVQLTVEDPQPLLVSARPGDDVTLPCQAPNNVNIAAAEWSRSDLERPVYMKRDGFLETADQDPFYKDRVQLEDDEMKNGDLSLVLKKVTSNDEGRYECLFREERGGRRKRDDQRRLRSIVQLTVEGPGGGDQEGGGQRGGRLGFILPVTLIVAAVAGLAGFVIYKKRRGRPENNPDQPGDDPDVHQRLQVNENSQKSITHNTSYTQV